MNHTTNLHLPQWEADDRILRTDFNDAFAAIDTACGDRSSFIPIKEEVLTDATSTISLAINDIDWSKWNIVVFEITPLTATTFNATALLNGFGNHYSFLGSSSDTGFTRLYVSNSKPCKTPTLIMLFPLKRTGIEVQGISLGNGRYLTYSYTNSTYAQLQTLSLSGGTFAAGTKLNIYGIQ